MKKIILIYGVLATVIIGASSALLLWSADPEGDLSQAEWLGYLIMIVGLSVIFVAVKQYRDQNLGGVIGFKSAFLVGLLITLITAAGYVLSWEVYYQSAGQDFIADYQTSYIENMRADGATENEIQETEQAMSDFAASYAKFYFRAFITLLEILPVGLVISLLSAWLLKTRSTG